MAEENTTPTVAEVLAILRTPGRVYVPVIIPGDVTYIQAVKADVLEYFAAHGLAPTDASPWYVIEGKANGDHYLADVEERS